jgi:hypothetical protein
MCPTSRAAVPLLSLTPYTHGNGLKLLQHRIPKGPNISGSSGTSLLVPVLPPVPAREKTVSGLLSQWIDIPVVGQFTVPETMVSTPDIPYIM